MGWPHGNWGCSDFVISPTRDVQTALNNAGFESVTATVTGETAILTGSVESEEVVNQVSAVALSVTGIRQVDNQLAIPVTNGFEAFEAQIGAALTSAGFDNLTVNVDGEMVTVSGTVPDEESLSAAALAVLDIPGVAQLDNRLEIGPTAGSPDLEVALLAALAGDEFAYVLVEVQNGLATCRDLCRRRRPARKRRRPPARLVASRRSTTASLSTPTCRSDRRCRLTSSKQRPPRLSPMPASRPLPPRWKDGERS